MDLQGSRALVAGATGELGGRLARALAAQGTHVALAGRDERRRDALATELGAPALALELRDLASVRACVDEAAERLGGLDLVVLATGVAAFGDAREVDEETTAEVFAVNVLGPAALVRHALGHMGDGGTIVALSAVVADYPTAGMAAYSASKAALSAYLAAVRRERRRDGVNVIDARPQHMDTGFSGRALVGTPPGLPDPEDADEVVERILDAVCRDRRELHWDLKSNRLVTG